VPRVPLASQGAGVPRIVLRLRWPRLDAAMFQLPRALRVTSRQPPHALEWWEQSLRRDDPVEEIRRLRRQLGFAIADAGKRPSFLRTLGRETDVQLQQLGGRATFGVGELASELRERCQLLEKTVDTSATSWLTLAGLAIRSSSLIARARPSRRYPGRCAFVLSSKASAALPRGAGW